MKVRFVRRCLAWQKRRSSEYGRVVPYAVMQRVAGSSPTPAGEYARNPDGTIKNHPLEKVIGSMEGELWEETLKAIKRNRKEVDRLTLGDD
jgi:hypothetical protein